MIKKIAVFAAGVAAAVLTGVFAAAAGPVYDIEVFNNVGRKDVVIVRGVEPKSVVSVHSPKGVLLGRKTAGSSSSEVSLSVTLPEAAGGAITVSVLEKGADTAHVVSAEYSAKPVSDVPSDGEVTIMNNVDKRASIYIEGLEPKDVVTVYSAAGKKLASGRVGNNRDEITLGCRQLTKEAGTLLISVRSLGKLESARAEYGYAAQEVTELTPGNIEVTNNVGKKGTFVMSGLETGNVVTIYSDKGKKLGSARCGSSRDFVSISVTLNKTGGELNVTLKEANKLPSDMLAYEYDEQPSTPELPSENITVTANPNGVKDIVYIEGLESGDMIKIYESETGASAVSKGSVGSKGDLTLSRASFGKSIWVSNTRKGMLEGERVCVTVPEVETSEPVVSAGTPSVVSDIRTVCGSVAIVNKAGAAGVIEIMDLAEGSVITVYNKEKNGSRIGGGTVASGSDWVSISVSQLNRNGGTIWITRKDSGKNESVAAAVEYGPQVRSEFALTANGADKYAEVEIENNSGALGTVTVRGLESGDVVKAYGSDAVTASVLASATCGNNSHVTFSVSKLSASGGYIHLTLTGQGYLESERVKVWYDAVNGSEELTDGMIEITNNTGIASVITVTGLYAGDVISVYNSETALTALGSGTVAANHSYVTFNLSSLKAQGGALWVSRKSSGCAESKRTQKDYEPVSQSAEVSAPAAVIKNNSNAPASVTVTGLNQGDVIKVYKTEISTQVLGSGAALDGGSATVNVPHLGAGAGSLFITVTAAGMTESERVEIYYAAQSAAPSKSAVTIVNNVTIDSTVTVSGLTAGDEVRVYSSQTGTTPIGFAIASGPEVTVNVGQLTASAGKVYVSVTNYGRCESSRTECGYAAQQETNMPVNVIITNNKDANASVRVTDLNIGDCIRVYSDSYGAILLGIAIADGPDFTFTIGKLSEAAGMVYVTRTSIGRHESAKKEVKYSAAQ